MESTNEIVNKNQKPQPADFEFMKIIGKGSFGKVYLAKHKSENKVYAIKVISKQMILKHNEKRHVMSERNVLLQNLRHPFLVAMHYAFQSSDKLYFVLDYANGGEMFYHLSRERKFDEERAKFYAAEITSALGYLHSEGIVYRDLKPENILLDATGHLMLTDFGLCKEGLYDSLDTTTTFCGTPEYLAPEVLRKEPYDRCVDWWCLGSVLYEMLFGLPPFFSRDRTEMYNKILHQPLRFRHACSPSARSILEALLSKPKYTRLGYAGDAAEVMSHEFFNSINWSLLEQKRLKPPTSAIAAVVAAAAAAVTARISNAPHSHSSHAYCNNNSCPQSANAATAANANATTTTNTSTAAAAALTASKLAAGAANLNNLCVAAASSTGTGNGYSYEDSFRGFSYASPNFLFNK